MRHREKTRSILLAVLLLASLLPFAALPARADGAPTGGYCGNESFNAGENVAWQLVGGTLTVAVTSSVESSMANYLAEDATAPWHDSCTSITSVVIGSGVTSIGDYAFYGCTGVTSVVLPDTVTTVGESAFQGCENLKYVFFPNTDSKLSIGENAFSGCAGGLTFYGDTKTNQSLGGITLQSCVTPDTWSKLQTAVSNTDTPAAYIKLTADVTRGENDSALTVPSDKTVLLDLNGHTISGGGSGSVLTVKGALTLADCDRSYSSSGGKATGKITGGSASSGGGVYVSEGGTFHMSGGEVSGNEANGYGGGVYVGSGGTFTMTGGAVSGNETKVGDGGGVYVGGTFTLSGGEISGNETGEAGDGGGVYVGSSATFTMLGGTVSDNKAHENGAYGGGKGGGVYVNGGTFTMSGSATVSDNKAENGGVCVDGSGSTFTLSGGTIGGTDESDANTATYGGGVCVENGGAFTMLGGAISGNTASQGGGVCVGGTYLGGTYVGGAFTMLGGAISGNTASQGGGVYLVGTFTMTGGTVSDNEAGFGGGGVYLVGTFTMSGGTVSGNTAKEIGGGVFVNGGTFRVSGAPVVRDNSNKNGPSNVMLNDQRITVAAPLTDGAALWVHDGEEDAVVATGDGHTLTDADAEKFHGDLGLSGALDDGSVKLVFRPALQKVGVADGTLSATVFAASGSTLIAAGYDKSDRLLGVATLALGNAELRGADKTLAVPANAARYRVFLVDGSYAPLCPAADCSSS